MAISNILNKSSFVLWCDRTSQKLYIFKNLISEKIDTDGLELFEYDELLAFIPTYILTNTSSHQIPMTTKILEFI